MSARIVRSRTAIQPQESFAWFSVYRDREDGRICGYLHYDSRDAASAYESTPFGVPVETAWGPARELVDGRNIDVVWLNDPENLFEPPEVAANGRAPTTGSPNG